MRPSQERLEQIRGFLQNDVGYENWQDVRDLLSEIDALRAENRKIVILGNWALFENEELLEALKAGLRGLVWFIEGPYGEPPTLDDLKNVRAVLTRYSTK